ncbi:hypothetical protein [Burkholderia metallica]|uniref:hypothetical protein n=1 Tax=Burkholderia metallica TaxID=488729 RepID=UPI000AAB92DC|nr:hypothetical protein [Burkholderia metallica]
MGTCAAWATPSQARVFVSAARAQHDVPCKNGTAELQWVDDMNAPELEPTQEK